MTEVPHNIASITAEPDPDGVNFVCRVKLATGGELVLRGPDAIPVFYTVSNLATEPYEDDRTVH